MYHAYKYNYIKKYQNCIHIHFPSGEASVVRLREKDFNKPQADVGGGVAGAGLPDGALAVEYAMWSAMAADHSFLSDSFRKTRSKSLSLLLGP